MKAKYVHTSLILLILTLSGLFSMVIVTGAQEMRVPLTILGVGIRDAKDKPKTTDTVEAPPKMVLIPAGKFRMGTNKLVGNESKPIHPVDLDAFWMDTHEVTVGEYKQFLMESGYDGSLHSKLSEYAPTDNHPIIGVSWRDAMAYAKWAGKRLPTEAEWEKAARGGLMDKHFPWGDAEIDSSKANYGNIQKHTMPVGSYPPNAYGLYDIAGNVAEWCMDPWDANFYANSPAKNPFPGDMTIEVTLANYESIKGLRVIRGGSWRGIKSPSFWVSARNKADAMPKYDNIGFRCVKDVQ